MNKASVTIILPTFQEFDSLPSLIESVEQVRTTSLPNLTLIIVDDDSKDGTEQLIRDLGREWVTLITRTEDRGLSPAVIEGIQVSISEYCVVMDADGSHPASSIPAMIIALQEGADFVVGSRYVDGGSTEDGWGILRWLNSKIATLMARPFTNVLDPMSGFLAFRKSTFEQAKELSPVGYKIGLELIVKCNCKKVTEVPIHFRTRQLGQSKLTLSVQWQYLQHVIRLLRHTKPRFVSVCSFALVGLSGVIVYIVALGITNLFVPSTSATIALSIWVTMTWNFIWDRKFAFWDAKKQSIIAQYIGFVIICSVGIFLNYFITIRLSESMPIPYAGLIGVAIGSTIGLIFNYALSWLLVFRT